MSGPSESQKSKIIHDVFTCFQKGLDIIINGRQACQPTEDSINRPLVSIITLYFVDDLYIYNIYI